MHELSIVMSIVELAEKTCREHGKSVVDKIDLEVGELAGIEFSALDFVWSTGVKGSVLELAEREILKIKGKGKCTSCETEFEMDNLFDTCPSCNGYFNDILSGKELRIKSMIIN